MTARAGFVCVVAVLLLLLAGCSTPLPPERATYAGVWRNGATLLAISPQGRVIYRVERGNGFRKSIQAPIQRFEGDNFVVGLGPVSTTFVVSAPPTRQPEGHWTMTVDGVELTRE